MNKVFLICIILIFTLLQLSAQKKQDTLYLKNGRIITGKLQSRSDTQYEILTSDGFFHRFSSEDVEKATKRGKSYVSLINPALDKAESRIKNGIAMTIIGAAAGVFGGYMIATGSDYSLIGTSDNTKLIGGFLAGSGIILMLVGIPTWINNSHEKKKIELELIQFKSPGMAYVNGAGIRIRF